MADIRCPACGWDYVPGTRWECGPDGCGFHFDTFATRARCPRCEAHFAVTWCPACERPSPHAAWYAAGTPPDTNLTDTQR